MPYKYLKKRYIRVREELAREDRRAKEFSEDFQRKLFEVINGDKFTPPYGMIACNILYSKKYSAMPTMKKSRKSQRLRCKWLNFCEVLSKTMKN